MRGEEAFSLTPSHIFHRFASNLVPQSMVHCAAENQSVMSHETVAACGIVS